MKRFIFLLCFLSIVLTAGSAGYCQVKISKEVLKDKIKGGWAGQTIGVSYGGPTEFKYMGIMIPDSVAIPWADTTCAWWYKNFPGLFDDLYMDLTFVDVYEKYGLDAPVDSFANAFAHAGYELWHANQAARYNILHGIMPPESGNWRNNPHADCIDFQIESDFAGLMSPGMPDAASDITDKIGHIMNYGDGWYGGVFVANMYAQAFVSSDIKYIVTEALKTVPRQSDFYKCISDVIKWHKKYPDDWTKTWNEVQKKWADEVGCPDGVQKDLDIDAKINAAYIAMGLLYGSGDYDKTIYISTRCGQDSDCNPSNAAGILGTVLGYSSIPDKWKNALRPVENLDFSYTTISLNDVYEMSYNHALKNIEKHGGKVDGNVVTIQSSPVKAVRYEKCFAGLYPVKREKVHYDEAKKEWTLNFEGTGFVITGGVFGDQKQTPDYFAKLEVYIDGSKTEMVTLPLNSGSRRTEVCWNYDLPEKQHNVKIKWLNPVDNPKAGLVEAVVYSDRKK
jgi:hypothetical protein